MTGPFGRYPAARALGLAASSASRLLRTGSGSAVGGRVVLALEPRALSLAAAGRELALVTGTNGKTTTRVLLTAALRTAGPVTSNTGGANVPSGLVAALAAAGHSPRAVLEVDEPYLPRVVAEARPRLAVLLNLTRDQLDRNAEVRLVAARWRSAVPDVPRVVANADDPLVVWAALPAPRVRWVAAGLAWRHDAVACPACGGVIRVVGGVAGAERSADWACACGLARPRPDWWLGADRVFGPAGATGPDGCPLRLCLPGAANRGNAALAVAAAAELGVPAARAAAAIEGVRSVEGRYLETRYAGRPVRLLLAKNPAGWQEALGVLRPAPAGVLVAVNARVNDGRDPAWLWDVPFEVLQGRFVVATGERSRDVAVRLRYAGVEHERVDRLAGALRAAAAPAGGPDGGAAVEAMANYTAFQQIRKLIAAGAGTGAG